MCQEICVKHQGMSIVVVQVYVRVCGIFPSWSCILTLLVVLTSHSRAHQTRTLMIHSPMNLPAILDPTIARSCELFDVVEDWRQRKNVGHNHQPHTHRLPIISNRSTLDVTDLRFSPVWLYIWVCRELGRVKRLSHTLHLCFFCVLDDILELN